MRAYLLDQRSFRRHCALCQAKEACFQRAMARRLQRFLRSSAALLQQARWVQERLQELRRRHAVRWHW